MWRTLFKRIGEKLSEISLGYVYTGMGVLSASGVILFVEAGEEMSIPDMIYNPYSWTAVTIGTLIFLVLGIIIQGLFTGVGRALFFLSAWYPDWHYFPRIEASPKLTPENEIELMLTNPKKRQRISLQAAYARLYSDVGPLPSLASGVAPYGKRLLFPLSSMNGKCSRKRIIGRIENGSVILFMGENNEEVMELSSPGIYRYYFNISGNFRGREYGGGDEFRIVITDNHEVKIRE